MENIIVTNGIGVTTRTGIAVALSLVPWAATKERNVLGNVALIAVVILEQYMIRGLAVVMIYVIVQEGNVQMMMVISATIIFQLFSQIHRNFAAPTVLALTALAAQIHVVVRGTVTVECI